MNEARSPYVLTNQNSPALWLIDNLWMPLAGSFLTDGNFCFIEQVCGLGIGGPCTHAHPSDEGLYILEGHCTFHAGASPPLTASEMLTFSDVAQIASEILGKPVTREVVSDESYEATLLAQGMPEVFAGLLLSLYTAARAGEFAVVDPTLERLIQRKPTTMREVLQEFLDKPEGPIFQGR